MTLLFRKATGLSLTLLAASLFFGGTTACGKDCATRCQEYIDACAPATPRDCVATCDPVALCQKEQDALAECVGTNCSCEADPSSNECKDLLQVKCKKEFDAYTVCAFS